MSDFLFVVCVNAPYFLQVAPTDQCHELGPRVGLFESALDVLLDHQASFVITVDRFRAACMDVMFAAEVHLEAVGL